MTPPKNASHLRSTTKPCQPETTRYAYTPTDYPYVIVVLGVTIRCREAADALRLVEAISRDEITSDTSCNQPEIGVSLTHDQERVTHPEGVASGNAERDGSGGIP